MNDIRQILADRYRKPLDRKRRGYGESIFLAPLYRRVETLTSPAQELVRRRAAGEPEEQIIRDFAQMMRIYYGLQRLQGE